MKKTINKGGRPKRSSTKHHNPRARTIGIYEPIIEPLRDASDGAAALYCLMKPLASWRGRLLDDVLRIRNAARPTKSLEEVDGLLDELNEAGLILRYEVDDVRCIEYQTWEHTSGIDRREERDNPCRLPDPPTFEAEEVSTASETSIHRDDKVGFHRGDNQYSPRSPSPLPSPLPSASSSEPKDEDEDDYLGSMSVEDALNAEFEVEQLEQEPSAAEIAARKKEGWVYDEEFQSFTRAKSA